ncbi:hypothetical protein BJX65DRAFT_302433 [Aspergillus insuetus]
MHLLTLAWTGLARTSQATALWGQMAASAYLGENSPWQVIYLTDYTTGSVYQGILWNGFNECSGGVECAFYLLASFYQTFGSQETSPGGYNFQAKM